jgi:hypothetical protein
VTTRIAGGATAIVVTAVIVLATGLPVELHSSGEARIRLAWRLDGAVVEECRTLSEEEAARLPAHMRRGEVCDERPVSYRLRVALDDRELVDREVRPGGFRGNRPLVVYLEEEVPPGEHDLRVRFDPLGADDAGLPSLELVERVDLGPRDVALVTWDREERALRLRTPDPR